MSGTKALKKRAAAATNKSSSNGTSANTNNEPLPLPTPTLVQGMPIASALLSNDTTSLGQIIHSFLPNPSSATVDTVVIEKTVGEGFTGGRSTPVYQIACTVTRQPSGQQRQRYFIAKLILMPSENDKNNKINYCCDARSGAGTTKEIDFRLWVKRESYAVERRFYNCAAPRLLLNDNNNIASSSSLIIPKLLASDRDGSQPWPVACFFMNDLRHAGFPCHPEFLSTAGVKRALRWLASFHALFWGEASISTTTSWRNNLWDRGGFWTIKERNEGPTKSKQQVMVAGMAQQWAQTVRFLETKHSSTISPHTRGLGKRLELAARPVADFLTRQSSKSNLGTLIHGDFKAANLFLAGVDDDDEDDQGDASSVAVLDFQFAGLGLGAEDVAYILFPDARGHYFESETELIEVYHEELISQLILQQKGGPSTLPMEDFRKYYELSRIDFVRYLLGKGWVASTDGDVRLVMALEATMDRLDGGEILSSEGYSQAITNLISA